MIVTYLEGGLGNLLFQICFTISLSLEHKTEYAFVNKNENDLIIKNRHGADVENYKKTILRNINFDINSFPYLPQINHQCSFNYFKPHYEPDCINFYKGYFQSEKFFQTHEKIIFQILKPDSAIEEYIRTQYPFLSLFNCASMHIRRGDYVQLPHHHPIVPLEYYHNTLKKFKDVDKILVFTNDKDWCYNNLFDSRIVYIDEPDWLSLYIMSYCKNHIMANSSFSWWGVKLSELFHANNKIIAYRPNVWFGPAIQEDLSDMLPLRWEISC